MTMRRTSLVFNARAGILGLCLLLLPVSSNGEGRPARAKPAPPVQTIRPEQTIQIKLRDLLGMVPKAGTPEQVAELIARLKAIEERLAAIEALLRNAPVPLPAPIPVTGTGR